MKIAPGNIRWCAVFNDKGEHPHIHMMVWSTHPKHAHLSKESIRQAKSKLTNDIFRDKLVRRARQDIPELGEKIVDQTERLPTVGQRYDQ